MPDAPQRPDRPPPDAARHARAKQLFLQALERPRAEREAWLAQACGDDAGLRDEVRSLLAHHTAATLRAPGAPTAAVEPPPPAPVAPTRPLGLRKRVADRDGPARRRRLALVLALAALLLLAGAATVYRGAERSFERLLADQLAALLRTGVVGIETWLDRELRIVTEFAAGDRIRPLVAALVDAAAAPDPEAALASEAAAEAAADLAALLAPQSRLGGRREYVLLDPAGRVLALGTVGDRTAGLRAGALLNEAGRAEVRAVLGGQPWLLLPFRRGTYHAAFADRAGEVLLSVLAPVLDGQGRPIAALAFVQHAEDVFGRLLAEARSGASGECFAFDRQGALLSELRPAAAPAGGGEDPSTLGLRLADPCAGPAADGTQEPPLTRMAADAVAGHDGVDVEGYCNLRGVPVVGAWRWLDAYGFGLATEMDRAEAYATLALPRRALAGLLVAAVAGLLLAGAAGLQVARLRREVRQERLAGQYELERIIGQGGAGQVWRARHALLQRPTAVKLLRPELLSPAALQLLEREVRITARLTHPNTIEVYDCGVAEDGRFFYAMELLDGVSLQHLVARHGAQPVARVVHVLRQMCASLAEAHAAGLVHRDVKPGNAMLCRLGGELDVVKVLDFGLVKDLAAPAGDGAPTLALSGTPLYMSPERLQPGVPADPRCDVWALGATAFKLLAGRDLWSGGVADVLVAVVTQRAPRVAAHAQVPPELDALLAECLDPDPARRPADARALLARVEALPVPPWTQADARAWWAARGEA